MPTEYTDSSTKLNYDCISRIETVKTNETIWYRGAVITPNGIVNVLYSEPKGTRMEFVCKGQLRGRHWKRQFQPRYLVNLARKFTEDIVNANA